MNCHRLNIFSHCLIKGSSMDKTRITDLCRKTHILLNVGCNLGYWTKLYRAPCGIFRSKCNPKKPTRASHQLGKQLKSLVLIGLSESISMFKLRSLLETFLEDKNNLWLLRNGSGGLRVLNKEQQNQWALKMTRFSRSRCLFFSPLANSDCFVDFSLETSFQTNPKCYKQCSLTTA